MTDSQDLCTAKERNAYYKEFISTSHYTGLGREIGTTPDDIFKFQVTETNLKALISTYDITTTCEEVVSGNKLPGIAELVVKPDEKFLDIRPYLDNLGTLAKEPMLRVLPFMLVLGFIGRATRFPNGFTDEELSILADLYGTSLNDFYFALKDDIEVFNSIFQSSIDGTEYDLGLVYKAYRSRVPLKEARY